MNKKKYIALILMLTLLSIPKVNAACTETRKQEFERIKNEYKITTEYNNADETYNMKIETADNHNFEYVFTITYKYTCNKISNTLTECTGLKPGTEFYARVIGKTNDCNELLKEEKIKLVKNNEFYNDPLCKGIEEFVLCQEMYDKEIDRETFEARVEIYKENKAKEEEKKQEEIKKEEEKTKIEKIIDYIQENIVETVIVVICILLLIIIIIIAIKSANKRRRLD